MEQRDSERDDSERDDSERDESEEDGPEQVEFDEDELCDENDPWCRPGLGGGRDLRSAYDRTFAPVGPEADEARDSMRGHAGLMIGVGLAIRRHRARLGVGQRAYARSRGWSKSHVARLESASAVVQLGAVVAALEGTGYDLVLVSADPGAGEDLIRVAPEHWTDLELAARDRGGRAFPAAAEVQEARAYQNYYHSKRYAYSWDLPRWVWHRPQSWWDGPGETCDGSRAV